MGNLCSSESDPFSRPGRPLGSTPATPASVSVPASASARARRVGGPPRTVGGGPPGARGQASSGDGNDARSRAAAAAEERFRKSKQGGKLQAKLDEERRKTNAQTLAEASKTETQIRVADQSTSALRHD